MLAAARAPSRTLLCHQQVDFKRLAEGGKEFEWERPLVCPRCHSCRLWGHGFVYRWFDGFASPLPLARFQCQDCGCIIQMRPDGYWPRCQATIDFIWKTLSRRIETLHWPPAVTRQRAGHWLSWLIRWIRRRGGQDFPSLFDAISFCRTENVSLVA